MAAQAWKLYNKAKKNLGAGSFALVNAMSTLKLMLVTSASNFATATLEHKGSLSGEVASGYGYSTSGKALGAVVWTAGASAGQYKLDASDLIWTATGGAVQNIKGAVIFQSGASAGALHLVCYASLTSSQFTLAQGNTLTIQFASGGIFTLA